MKKDESEPADAAFAFVAEYTLDAAENCVQAEWVVRVCASVAQEGVLLVSAQTLTGAEAAFGKVGALFGAQTAFL